MKQLFLFMSLGLFLLCSTPLNSQSKPPASNGKMAKLTSATAVRGKTKTPPKDKKMGLDAMRRPETIENDNVAAAYDQLDSKNWGDAIDNLDDYAESDADAAFGLGYAYAQNEQPDKAIEAYQHVLELDESNTDALYELAEVLREQGRYQEAEEKFLALLEIDPMDIFAWYELGYIYLETGFNEDAAECFEAILDIDESDADALYELSRLAAIDEDIDLALDYLERALESGFDDEEFIREDPDLENLLDTERFDELMEQYFR
ncbi:MAG: tetratricopeptide repeat protein [Saprospiraceae bacterium]|nr:tetratricopeptide repeat protein [Lewinella sp.]